MKKELTYFETITMIAETKKFFESQLETRLSLTKNFFVSDIIVIVSKYVNSFFILIFPSFLIIIFIFLLRYCRYIYFNLYS